VARRRERTFGFHGRGRGRFAAAAIAAAALCLGASGCASLTRKFEGRVLFQDDRLTTESISDNSLMLFPLIRTSGFDTAGSITAVTLAQWLHRSRPDLEIFYKEEFEQGLLGFYPVWLDTFYSNLFAGNTLALQSDTLSWVFVPSNYALAIRIKEAGRVKDFDRRVNRGIWFEAELWSTNPAGVVWRAEVRGVEGNVATPDAEFIRDGMEKIFSLLPPYHPALHENLW
jgi:hypothetical protein